MQLIETLTQEEIKEYGKVRQYNTNEVLFVEGELCDNIGIILSGKMNVSTYGLNETEVIITTVGEGELFGEYLLFSNNPIYLGTGIALMKTTAFLIPKEKLLLLLQKNKPFLTKYLETICMESFALKQDVKLYVHKNIRERIMYYLESHAKENIYHYTSVADLARKLSLPRPSVSRELTNMETNGYIVRSKKMILIKKH